MGREAHNMDNNSTQNIMHIFILCVTQINVFDVAFENWTFVK